MCECVGAISADDAEEAKDDAAHLIVWHVISGYVVMYFIFLEMEANFSSLEGAYTLANVLACK